METGVIETKCLHNQVFAVDTRAKSINEIIPQIYKMKTAADVGRNFHGAIKLIVS